MLRRNRLNRSSVMSLGMVITALLYLYYPILLPLLETWGANDNYSHGYFIPLMSLYMIYSQKRVLASTPLTSGFGGILIIIAGLGLLVVSKIESIFFLQCVSFIVTSLGLVFFLCGWGYLKRLTLPLLYLLFMIPLPANIWNKAAFPMQLLGASLTELVIYSIGIPIYRETNVLHLAEITMEVNAACSGLRSLMIMFALSWILAYFSNLSIPRRWVLFFCAAPIAIFTNIVRLTATVALASRYGLETAHGFLHGFSGLLIFVLGLVLLITVNNLLAE